MLIKFYLMHSFSQRKVCIVKLIMTAFWKFISDSGISFNVDLLCNPQFPLNLLPSSTLLSTLNKNKIMKIGVHLSWLFLHSSRCLYVINLWSTIHELSKNVAPFVVLVKD